MQFIVLGLFASTLAAPVDLAVDTTSALRVITPVCSSTGVYYSNSNSISKSQRSTKLVPFKGKCVNCCSYSGKVCTTGGVIFQNDCALVANREVKSFSKVVRGRTCVNCDSVSGPVCSSGGIYFANQCEMKKLGLVSNRLWQPSAGECVAVPCATDSGPKCSTTSRYFDSECTLFAANQYEDSLLVPYSGKCLYCDKYSGPVCATEDGPPDVFENNCALLAAGYTQSTLFKVDSNNTCSFTCDPNIMTNPVCATNGVYYRNYCEMVSARQQLATNYIYDSVSGQCIEGQPQDPSAFQ